MNKFLHALALFSVIIGIGGLTGTAFAQNDTSEINDVLYHLVTASTFLIAGIFYSASGYINKLRRSLSGEKVEIDYVRMGKTMILGVVLGIGAFILSIYNGDIIHVDTMHEFFVQVGLNAAAILFIHKWILASPK